MTSFGFSNGQTQMNNQYQPRMGHPSNFCHNQRNSVPTKRETRWQGPAAPHEISVIISAATWKRFLIAYNRLYPNKSKLVNFTLRKRTSLNLPKLNRFSQNDEKAVSPPPKSNKVDGVKCVLGSFDQWPAELKDYCKEVYRACGKSQELIAKAHRFLLETIEKTLETNQNLNSVRWLNLPIPDFIPQTPVTEEKVSLGSTVTIVEQKSNMTRQRRQKTFANVDKLTSGLQEKLSFIMNVQEPKAEMTAEIVGTSTELEKNYLRLTSTPDAANIRPLPVLRQAFDFVCEKAKSKDLRYLCDQLRSIRQDLTVQNIKNEFTMKVYETNAIAAIQAGDGEEFNQCQSRLMDLYTQGFDSGNRCDFTGYRILYCIFTKDDQGLMETMTDVIRLGYRERLEDVLSLYYGWASKNANLLFRSYRRLTGSFRLVADMFIQRERNVLLTQVLKAFRPTVSVEWIGTQLAFENPNQCQEHLKSAGNIVLLQDDSLVDCKASL